MSVSTWHFFFFSPERKKHCYNNKIENASKSSLIADIRTLIQDKYISYHDPFSVNTKNKTSIDLILVWINIFLRTFTVLVILKYS